MTFSKTKLKNILFAFFVILFLPPCQSFVAADVVCTECDNVKVVGEIDKGDFCKLIKCLSKFIENGKPKAVELKGDKYSGSPVGWVTFNSVGGDVQEAIKIGRFLREGLVEVVIHEKCYSSCFTAVTGAIKVYEGSDIFGEVGIHRMFLDKKTLINMNMQEYEKVYNKIKMGARNYFIDMDVPVSIIEKIFTIPSGDLYILKGKESEFLWKNPPAYDEWIEARCPNPFSKEEQKDFRRYRDSFYQKGLFSEGYTDYLNKKNSEFEDCREDFRWKQFKKTVNKYLKKCK
ncbi:MAG: hypothetical protein KKF12_12015 [Proteobacteria bacterium]|nr:hypothetical protein [Desulfobacula sp.]MBU3915248.1 hypothetical protein [bacterium]MBU4131538.1 hypothetical protein [Pseudomonadota bacterium]